MLDFVNLDRGSTVRTHKLFIIYSFIQFFLESLLKKRWKAMRNEHRKIIAYNHTHSKKVPLHKMAKELKFLRVDLNGASKMDFSDLEKPKTESFCVTQEMLDSCDINGSVTHDTISFQKIMNMKMPTSQLSPSDQTNGKERSNASNEAVPKEIAPNDKKEDTIKSKSDYSASNQTNTGAEVSASNSDANNRCEDTIFAELVAAILKKMNPDEKKRAKKEIMNILL